MLVRKREGAMLRLSRLTDYAVVVLVRLAREDGVTTTPALASATGVPEPTVAKVLKLMAAQGMVASQRGARGGYRLARPLHSIAVSEVIAAIDGPISLTACVDGATGGCEAQHCCPIRGRWDPVNDAIRLALGRITLQEMSGAGEEPKRPSPPTARNTDITDDTVLHPALAE
jgi:FeS assembly SUF system regulator